MSKKLSVRGKPAEFHGSVRLPPSKSYVHRALFIASLGKDASYITECGKELADDILATIEALRAFGVKIDHSSEAHGTLSVVPGKTNHSKISVFARGSGTTARFAISFAALANEGTSVRISGDDSLSRRPMQSIFESLSQLRVRCSFEKDKGKLPITIMGGGIEGGECWVDGSISSQFISSLLISCTRARNDCTIRIKDPTKLVSKPYIDATLATLQYFGLDVKPISRYSGFKIRANQIVNGRKFSVPGDMSTAAALIGATLAASGSSLLLGVSQEFPQSDSAIIPIAKKLGASIVEKSKSLRISSRPKKIEKLSFDLNRSPDIAPVVAGLAAALGASVKITNIGHLRFKESDRISVLSRELRKLGLDTKDSGSTLQILGKISISRDFRKPIFIDPEKDHRMLMALAIAGLSGRYGEILISDPDCVRKSYPTLVKDLQKLCHEKKTVKIVDVSR